MVLWSNDKPLDGILDAVSEITKLTLPPIEPPVSGSVGKSFIFVAFI